MAYLFMPAPLDGRLSHNAPEPNAAHVAMLESSD